MKGRNHIAAGRDGESLAEAYLCRRGFQTRARNWRPGGTMRKLEIDIVGSWEGYLVFIEVKTRRPGPGEDEGFPPALKNFSPAKQRNLARAAKAYLAQHAAWDIPCRFDLVCVTLLSGKPPLVEHYGNVIEIGQTLDSGDASWQPW